MTLIIGRAINNKVYILGDTALTYYDLRKTNPFIEGCLKQYVITDKLAIAFADNPSAFEIVCPKLFSASNAHEIINITLEAQKNGSNFELLIGEVGYKNIRTIKDGLLNEASVGYIGDKAGFEAFQRYFHVSEHNVPASLESPASVQIMKLPEPVTEGEIYSYLYAALKEVILDKEVQTVGGMIIPLCTDNGQFRYLNYADVTSDPLNINESKDIPKVIEFGTVEKGGYSVEFCDDTSYGGQGRNVGYYFLQGGFGIIFPTSQTGFRVPKVVPAENPAYWVLETKKLLGHGIGSGYLTVDHCGIAGEKLLQEGKAQDALFCYELRKDDKSLANRPALQDRYISGYAAAIFNCDDNQQITAIRMLEQFIETHPVTSCCKNLLEKMLITYKK